jgi:hypothetical protein
VADRPEDNRGHQRDVQDHYSPRPVEPRGVERENVRQPAQDRPPMNGPSFSTTCIGHGHRRSPRNAPRVPRDLADTAPRGRTSRTPPTADARIPGRHVPAPLRLPHARSYRQPADVTTRSPRVRPPATSSAVTSATTAAPTTPPRPSPGGLGLPDGPGSGGGQARPGSSRRPGGCQLVSADWTGLRIGPCQWRRWLAGQLSSRKVPLITMYAPANRATAAAI